MAECDKYQDLISCYIDGTISEEDRQRLFKHIESCEDCAQLLEIYSDISRTMADDAEPPEELLSGVMSGVREINEKRRKASRQRHRRAAVWLAAAACAVIMIIPASRLLLNRAGSADEASAGSEDFNTADGFSPEVKEYTSSTDDASADEQETGSQALPTLEDVAQGYYAVVYASVVPTSLEVNDSRLTLDFADGSVGIQITLAEFTALEETGSYEIDYCNDRSDSALLVYTP